MVPSPSSRSVDPRLSGAAGVMRDTVGAIRNLQNLLGSIRVGPKALASVLPAIHASCKPMIAAAHAFAAGAEARNIGEGSVPALGRFIASEMEKLERELFLAKKGSFRATRRLALEAVLAEALPALEGALELVELVVEASALGGVRVDVWDVVRETGIRTDAGTRRITLSWKAPSSPLAVRANPRLAVRLVSLAAAFAVAPHSSGVEVTAVAENDECRLLFSATTDTADGVIVTLPPLIASSGPCARAVASSAGIAFQADASASADGDARTIGLTFPLAPPD